MRSVITEQTNENTYAATMESQNATVENQLFDNVSTTQYPIPPGFNNPVDTSNHYGSMLDGSAGNNSVPRVGPAIVLKVMAGDTVTIATQAWYTGTVEPPPSGASNLLNDLLNALTGGVISNSHSLYSTSDNSPNTVLSGDLPQFFTHQEDSLYNISAPKAFLNWVAFDNQLNMNAANSGVVQVPTITGSESAQPLVAPEQIIQKDGYLYIYVSNESAQKVFFDNLVIHHNKGHLLEEDQYYPFGLKMAGISDQALPPVPNNYLYNGKELNHEGFSDGTGLDWYSYGMREYDPQLARFPQLDPLTDEFPTLTPYQYASNDPVANIDWDGLEGFNVINDASKLSTDAAFGIVDYTAAVITAAKPLSTSASLLKGLSALSEIEGISSIFLHSVQTLGLIIGNDGTTNAVGSQINSSEMKAIFPGANDDIVNGFVKNFNQYSGQFGITDDETTAQFLAQSGKETQGFTRLSENMDYTSEAGLESNFPRLFVSGNYNAKDYVNNGGALAKLAYGANKSGLDYRGRGTIQLTREGNYKRFTGFYDKQFNSSLNFVTRPNLLSSNYKYATISGLWFFMKYIINTDTDVTSVTDVTKVITGGKTGLADRITYFGRASAIISVSKLSGIGLFGIF